MDFPAVRLLHKAPVEQQRRRRLRELILLALRVTAWRCLRWRSRDPYIQAASGAVRADDGGRPRYFAELVGAWPVRSGARGARRAVSAPPTSHGRAASRSPIPPLLSCRRRPIAAACSPGSTRRRLRAARVSAPRWRARPRRSPAKRAGSSSSPICSKRVGRPATRARCPTASRSRSPRSRRPTGNLAVTACVAGRRAVIAGVHNFETGSRASGRGAVGGTELDSKSGIAASGRRSSPGADAPCAGGAEVRWTTQLDQADNARFLVLDPPAAVPVVHRDGGTSDVVKRGPLRGARVSGRRRRASLRRG